MRLFIAEKPSLGRAIVDVLPKPHRKQEGCIYSAQGDCVTWCIGHLLEQAEPEKYHPEYKKWSAQHLPIIPDQWQLVAKSKTRQQLAVIKKLLTKATTIVHAGDPDREGQLLVDQVISHSGVTGDKAKSVQRLLINDLNPSAVRLALSNLRSNSDFIPLSTSALARSRADWLYGINMTRAYTLQGRKVGYNGVLSVGRVQTPLLGLVVGRDQEIERFVSKPFYQVEAILKKQDGSVDKFTAKWRPSAACRPYQDEQGRVLSKPLAENVCSRINGQPGFVKSLDRSLKKLYAPLPLNLSALQIEANKRFGMTAQQVLDHCQQLYEKHQLITYPRSDSRYLPLGQWSMANNVCSSVASNLVDLKVCVNGADTSIKSKVWNDAKVDAHHAIIPSQKKTNLTGLPQPLQQLYELISRFYLAQFYGPFQFNESVALIEVAGGLFVAKAKQKVDEGYKNALPDRRSQQDSFLPDIAVDEMLSCIGSDLQEKKTEPPKPFTDASLLAAMTGISRYVHSDDIRKILKESDGLGTEATRAGIIELLFRRKFLRRENKTIRATAAGTGLVQSLPQSATTADMTAQWESALDAISERKQNYASFMTPLVESLYPLVNEAKATLPAALKGVVSEPPRYKKKRRK